MCLNSTLFAMQIMENMLYHPDRRESFFTSVPFFFFATDGCIVVLAVNCQVVMENNWKKKKIAKNYLGAYFFRKACSSTNHQLCTVSIGSGSDLYPCASTNTNRILFTLRAGAEIITHCSIPSAKITTNQNAAGPVHAASLRRAVHHIFCQLRVEVKFSAWCGRCERNWKKLSMLLFKCPSWNICAEEDWGQNKREKKKNVSILKIKLKLWDLSRHFENKADAKKRHLSKIEILQLMWTWVQNVENNVERFCAKYSSGVLLFSVSWIQWLNLVEYTCFWHFNCG